MKTARLLLVLITFLPLLSFGASDTDKVYYLKVEEFETFSANATAGDGTLKWSADCCIEIQGDDSGPSVTVKGVTPGSTTLKLTLERESDSGTKSGTCASFKIVVVNPKLDSIKFKNSHRIKSDFGEELVDGSSPHWTPGKQYPVGYKVNDPLKLDTLGIDVGTSLEKYKPTVKLTGTYGKNGTITKNIDSKDLGSSILELKNIDGSGAISDTIDYNSDFKISLKLEIDGKTFDVKYGGNGEIKGNEMYVTGATPSGSGLLETVLHLACDGAKGASDTSGIISGVWSKFQSNSIKRKSDNRELAYWRGFVNEGNTTEDLLKSTNGDCQSWAEFFIDSLKVHGIPSRIVYIMSIYSTADPRARGRAIMLIKNWEFRNGTADEYWIPFSHEWYEYSPGVRIMAKGNSDSPSMFVNHYIVESNGVYYDPSYGSSGDILNDIENKGIAGYQKTYENNGPTLAKPNNPSLLEIEDI